MADQTPTQEPAQVDSSNPFLFDADRLSGIASDAIIRRGGVYFRENHVTEVGWDATTVWGLVQGSDPDSCYTVELTHDQDGELCVSCDCPFDWEPMCKHAVAVLLEYSSQISGDQRAELTSAADVAVEERAERARTEVRVNHIAGEPAFGSWTATSVSSASHHQRSYTVQIRSLQERANYCTCPDWASNQLGTCKHVEAVLHRLRKMGETGRSHEQSVPLPFIYLSWSGTDGPAIRLQRSASMDEQLSQLLGRYFDASGQFRGDLPDDFFRFHDQVRGRDDLLVGEDAILHVRGLAEDAAHRIRGEHIRQEILRSGNSLPGVRARLYPYQVEGAAFLAARGRALLADDMGLGKTLQAITAAHWLRQRADLSTVLVVCPASLKQQWAGEIERFTGSRASVIQGPPSLRAEQYRKGDGFLVVNYELVTRDLSYINETVAPDLLILDEAQRIKNWRTKIASTIKLISSRYAFVLTGTPLENRLEDLYSLMQVVDHRVLGPLWRYMIDFHVTDERGKVLGYRNLSELRRRLAPVMLRRDRTLVRDQLPARIEQRLDVPMTPKQLEIHDSALRNAASYAAIAKRRPLTPVEQNRLMAALQQARMACDAVGLVDKETHGAPKLDELSQLLDELCLQEGLKAVVFSQWERMTAMAEQVARALGIGCVRLHGGIPSSKRGSLLNQFRDDDATRVFISTDAGGVGLNLQSASVLINLDMPWNPAVLDQRIARVHRLGQSQTVQVILMVAADSYEVRVAELVQKKRDLFDNVVDAAASEDVVGVSKRLLETLLEDLQEPESKTMEEAAEEAAEEAGAVQVPAPEEPRGSTPETVDTTAEDAAVRQAIADIQTAFGPRVERILGARGGLLVVVDHADEALESKARELSDVVPVALIEPRTLAGLERLGSSSPVGEILTLFDAGQRSAERAVPTLLGVAERKLEAAEALIERSLHGAAMELLASSMVAAAACRANLAQAPSLAEAPVWVYSEALPGGVVSQQQATAIIRAQSLSTAVEIPPHLVQEALDDARQLVAAAH